LYEFIGKRPNPKVKQDRTVPRHITLTQRASDYLDARRTEDLKFNASELISSLIEDLIAKEELVITQYKLVKCIVCGAEYSNKYSNCVLCESNAIKEKELKEKIAEETIRATQEAADLENYTTRMKEVERRLKLEPELYAQLIELYKNTPDEKKLFEETYEDIFNKYIEKEVHIGIKNIMAYFEYLKRQVV
jgi:hypothetical protein